MMSQTETNLARARAQFAYDDVTKWAQGWRKEALARVKGLPIQTRTQGLTITLASLMREGKVHATHLADLMGQWLLQEAPHSPLGELTSPSTWSPSRQLLDACMKAERSAYQAAQTEAMAFLEQVKLFADALYGVGDL
jgi:hypothetical protein